MSAYSSVTIDGTDVVFDPDTLSVNNNNIVSIDNSMGGTSYVTSVKSTSGTNYNRTVNIGGMWLCTHGAQSLLTSSSKKTAVTVGGGLVGISGSFIILSMSLNPIKPKLVFDSDTSVKYSYSVSLREVT